MNIRKTEELSASKGETLGLNSVLIFDYIHFSVPSVVSVVEEFL